MIFFAPSMRKCYVLSWCQKVKVLFVTGTEDTSPEEPPIKPIWTTPIGVSNGPPLITRHPKRSHQHHLQVIK